MPASEEWLQRALRFGNRLPTWLRFGIAVIAVLVVGAANYQMDKPFLLYFPLILVGAVFLGRGGGYVVAAASAVYVTLYLPPIGSLAVSTPQDQFGWATFVFSGFGIAFIVETLRSRIDALSAEKNVSETLAHDRKLLVDELAHRTRNDLANVVTLLKLQAASSVAEAKESFKEAIDRVQSIARVHHRLEVRDERVVVDSKEYLEELCGDLHISRFTGTPIRLECKAESHRIGLEKALPIGLIVNELVTNSAKHAFPSGRAGEIIVSFKRIDGRYRLSVEDDGVGHTGSIPTREGLGSKLLGLLAGQLGSKFAIGAKDKGTLASVEIPVRARSSGASSEAAHTS